jgi:UDP-3-O-[3-hydroxymyristoyl] N-acetylglucosamine deacetylase
MGAVRQKTLRNSIHCSGIGLHSGERVAMTLHPAEADSGIRFRRSDLGGREVAANWRNAIETPLCTTLIDGDGTQMAVTIEHLLSAFAGCEIDNVLVEIDAGEVPAMDGSAAPFVFLIECAGTVVQDEPRRAVRILKEVEVSEPERCATLSPSGSPAGGLSVSFEIDFDSRIIAHQEWFTEVNDVVYKREIARARTFGLMRDVARLQWMGLALGGSLDNAIVVDEDRILNEEGLRFENEFVRHKVLDSIGDLYLAGGPVLGHFNGVRAGHCLTTRLLKKLFADKSAWELVDLSDDTLEWAADGAALPPMRAVAASA